MEYKDFIAMSLEERAQMVWAKGIFLSKKRYPHKVSELYSLSSFFVELWFLLPENAHDFIFLDYVRSFPRIKAIDKYLTNEECFNLIKAC